MLFVKIWGLPTVMLNSSNFEQTLSEWKTSLKEDICKLTELNAQIDDVVIFFPHEGYQKAPPKRLVVEVTGSQLRFTVQKIPLGEVAKYMCSVVSKLYQSTPIICTVFHDDLSQGNHKMFTR